MKFSLIVCTLGTRPVEFQRLISSLEQQTYKDFEIIVVSQLNHSDIERDLSKTSLNYSHIKIDKKGLSLSRNIGIQHANGEFISISDDDCWYPPQALQNVCDAIETYSADAYCFQIYDPLSNQLYKSYSNDSGYIGRFKIGKVSSIEIFFHNSISCTFDEEFGLGTKYPSGEENIFLSDMIKKQYKVYYIPEIIVYHRIKELTTITLTPKDMEVKYKVFKRMYGTILGLLVYFAFYIKHFKIIKNNLCRFSIKN